jgi:hypothetical protein
MQPEQGIPLSGCKPFAANAAVEQFTVLILTVFAANCNVALVSKSVQFARFVGTEVLVQIDHRLPPTLSCDSQSETNIRKIILNVSYKGTLPKI